jgi:CRISPR-associated endonuclease/helicase Cas3
LLDHSADVAAVFAALLRTPGVRVRLEELAGPFAGDETSIARLGVLATLHDFGKANRGFQARWHPHARPIGHVREAMLALSDPLISARVAEALPVEDANNWFGAGSLLMAIAHHGLPLDPIASERDDMGVWAVANGHDPVASLVPLGLAARQWFPAAFR